MVSWFKRREDEKRRRDAAHSEPHEVLDGGYAIHTSDNEELYGQMEAAMNDPSEWGEPLPEPKKRSEKRRRSAMFSIRFTSEELEVVADLAKFHNKTVSGFIRELVLAEAQRPRIKAFMTQWPVSS